eukprot:347211-Ditylum_brightwellii.AAC.1
MATAKKKVKSIKTSSEDNWNAGDNNSECSDDSNYGSSNSDNNDSSKTDQIAEKLLATMMNNKNKQMP